MLCLFKSRAHQSVLLNGAAFVRDYTTWINVQDKDKKKQKTKNTAIIFLSSEKDLEKPTIKTCAENLNLNFSDENNLGGHKFLSLLVFLTGEGRLCDKEGFDG